jgi:alpha-galactosidase
LPTALVRSTNYTANALINEQATKQNGSRTVHAARYDQNLVQLIMALRKDFNSPEAKFVVATGCGNRGREGFGLQIAEAQLAVDGSKGKYPEFKGNVTSVDVRPFWREADVSPVNQGYHYNHNAETYMSVGESMGWAIVRTTRQKLVDRCCI